MSGPVDRVLGALRAAGLTPRRAGDGWTCPCPAHDDRNPSLSIDIGDDGRALVKCHAGCAIEDVCGAIGLRLADLFADDPSPTSRNGHVSRARPASTFSTACEAVADLEQRHGRRSAAWTYQDAEGEPVGMVVRWDISSEKVVRPVSRTPSGWTLGGMPAPRPLYQLPDVLAAPAGDRGGRVYVVEGEKAADAARALGLLATTSPHGSKSAAKADWSPLAGRDVVILPDHDEAGERYAVDVARLARTAGATSVRVLRLADHFKLPAGGDLADLTELAGENEAERYDFGRRIEALADAAHVVDQAPPSAAAMPDVYVPFPTDTLPGTLRRWAESRALACGVDPAMLAGPALAVLAGAVGATARLVVRPGWEEPCCLWIAVLSRPGALKTPCLRSAAAPALRAQRIADANYARNVTEWEASHPKRTRGEAAPDDSPRPTREQWIAQDATPEAMARVLSNNPRGVVAIFDELGALFGGFGRYNRGAGESGSAFWRSGWSGEPFTVNRVGPDGAGLYLRLDCPLLSIAGMMPPASLERLATPEHHESGLLSRFALIAPPDCPAGWSDDPSDLAAVDSELDALHARLRAIPLRFEPESEGGGVRPALIDLAPDAVPVAKTWVNEWAERMRGMDDAERSVMSKVKGATFRLALLLRLLDWAEAGGAGFLGAVDAPTLQRAIKLGEWLARETLRNLAAMGEPAATREHRRLVEWVRDRGGTATVNELTHGPRKYRGPDGSKAAEAALNALVEAGLARWERVQGDQGGRPTRRIVLGAAPSGTGTETPCLGSARGGFSSSAVGATLPVEPPSDADQWPEGSPIAAAQDAEAEDPNDGPEHAP